MPAIPNAVKNPYSFYGLPRACALAMTNVGNGLDRSAKQSNQFTVGRGLCSRRKQVTRRAAFPRGKVDFRPKAEKTDEGENTFSSRLAPCHCTLAVPKIFCGMRLEYFDRGAKPCSLFRPPGALRRLCSQGAVFNAPVFYKRIPQSRLCSDGRASPL